MINKILFFLFLLFLPTQLGKHFFLPFSYLSGVRVDYLSPTVYLTDIIVFLLAIINLKIVLKFFKNKKIITGLLLLLINVLFSKLPMISFYWFVKIIELLIVFSLTKKMLATLKERSILVTLLFSGLFELFLAIAQLTNKHSIQGVFYYFGERLLSLSTPGVAKAAIQGVEFLRPYGTFSHPNSLAGFFLLLYFFVLTYKKFNRYLALKYLFIFISSILVFVSFSKVAIISYLILNTSYFILNTKIDCRLCKIARIIVMFVVSLIFLSATSDPLTIDKRIELMKNSLNIIVHNPIFGVGLGSYLIEQAKFPSKFYLFFNQPVHNIFLLFVSEVGLVLSGFLLYKLISQLIKRRLTKDQWMMIFVIIFTGFFDHYWLTLEQNFLLMGLVMGAILYHDVSVG
ncbi:MAG: O-antigen ligase family protein [Patescibacteria group bacterium]